MKYKHPAFLLILLLAFPTAMTCLTGCSERSNIAGGSVSESGNAIVAGRVVLPGGSPAVGAKVRLRPAEYLSPAESSLPKPCAPTVNTVTDSEGWFQFDSVAPGAYRIEVRGPDSLAGLYDVTVDSSGSDEILPEKILEKLVIVSGRVALSPGVSGAHVRVRGMDRLAQADSATGRFALDLPSGDFIMFFSLSGDSTVTAEVPVTALLPGETRDLGNIILKDADDPYYAWTRFSRIAVNTSAAGASVTEDVYDFPLLVRLNPSVDNETSKLQDFFSTALPDGADLRFAKSDGETPLPYEIERWDATNELAEIWVNVDTIYGNNDSQFIYMYTGNGDAPAQSSGFTVFDTSNGFEGVWHLGEEGGSAGNDYMDATYNEYHGTGVSMTADSDVSAITGKGQEFDGVNDYIVISGSTEGELNFSEYGRYTVSAWVYPDVVDTIYHPIVAKGDHQYVLTLSSKSGWSFEEWHEGFGWENSRTPAETEIWTYAVGVRDGSNQYLYLNGELVVDTIDFWEDLRPTTQDYEVRIGQNEEWDERYFDGKLDEVRLSSASRSSSWIKLCYENQKPDSRIVRIE
jgi:hypothetical protein